MVVRVTGTLAPASTMHNIVTDLKGSAGLAGLAALATDKFVLGSPRLAQLDEQTLLWRRCRWTQTWMALSGTRTQARRSLFVALSDA